MLFCLLWFFWIDVEPIVLLVLAILTSGIPDNLPLKEHLLDSAAHMRLITMGIILLVTLRFAPKGLIPEK